MGRKASAYAWPFEILPDDTYLVAYPRSGTWWVRTILAGLIDPRVLLDAKLVRGICPDPYSHPDALGTLISPRFIKSHAPQDPGFPRVVYVLRDGRDALASYYDYALRRSEFSGSFPEFVAGRLKDPLVGFGPWPDHVRHWLLGTRSRPTLLLRFEDLYRKPEVEVQRLASFLGLGCDEAVIEAAIRSAREHFEAEGLNPHPARFRGLGEGPGSWRKRFTPELADLFWQRAGDVMLKTGYTRT